MNKLSGTSAFIAAMAFGTLTAFLAWRYVEEVRHSARPPETAPVVVAAVPIASRTVLTADMLRVQDIPLAGRHPDAIRAPNEVVGKVARTFLTPGEQVLNAKLFLQRQESGLAFIIPSGKRAVSVGFTEIIGSGGLVLPGDRVDVIGVFEARLPLPSSGPAPSAPSPAAQQTYVAAMVLQNVEVLAVAQRLEGEDTRDGLQRLAQGAGSAAKGPSAQPRSQPQAQPQAKTITLAVSPDQALRLALAEERGKIRLALRRAGDDTLVDVAELPLAAIVQPSR